jgi:hypothetical protein
MLGCLCLASHSDWLMWEIFNKNLCPCIQSNIYCSPTGGERTLECDRSKWYWPKCCASIELLPKSISSSAECVTLQKYYSHPSLVICLFANPTYKTETGTANTRGTSNSKPPGLIIMMGQSETLGTSQIILLHFFMQVHIALVRLLPANRAIILSQNYFPEPNQHILTFLHLILCLRVIYWAPLEML